jgi:hypothetical protein
MMRSHHVSYVIKNPMTLPYSILLLLPEHMCKLSEQHAVGVFKLIVFDTVCSYLCEISPKAHFVLISILLRLTFQLKL